MAVAGVPGRHATLGAQIPAVLIASATTIDR